jgi:hypothetical protein
MGATTAEINNIPSPGVATLQPLGFPGHPAPHGVTIWVNTAEVLPLKLLSPL